VNIADHLPTSAPYLGQGYPISLKHVYCSHSGLIHICHKKTFSFFL